MKKLYAVTVLLVLSTFSGAQLQSSVERPCPGESVTFTCKIQSVGHVWHIQSLNITRELLPGSRGGVISDHPPFQFAVTEVVTGSITSTATVTATDDLNGTLVVCQDGIGMEPEQRNTINIIDPPSVPTLSCIDISEDDSGAVNITVSWTLSGGDSADFYLISIITNAPQSPYGGLLNITNGGATRHELTGFMAGYEYGITLHGVNCGSLKGGESEPLIITLRVPADPKSCNITLSYNQQSRTLLFINSTWDTVPDPVNPCPGIRGDITQYQISFQTGSVMATENVNIARCIAGRCSHNFEPPSNPPLSYHSVSVAAENVVGVGTPRICTTQTISTSNPLLTGAVVGVSSPTDARLNCTFVSWFVGSANCTVQYGTDPTYMGLPYSAESTETGTAGDTVSVVLRERLNSSTVYYYTVSAVSGDVTAVVRGTFTTEQYTCNITELWNLPAPGVTLLSDVSLLNTSAARYPSCNDSSVGSTVLENTTLNTATVAYYTGVTSGASACFVCNDGYELNTTTTDERFCQGNGLWSGNPTICVCRLPPQTIALIALGAFAMVVALFSTTVTISDGIIAIWTRWNAKRTKTVQQRYRENKYEIGRDKTNFCWHALLVTATIFLVIGVILWITVGIMVSNPPNGNACDPSWRSTRDGLIVSAFAVSSLAFFLAVAAVWLHVCYHTERIRKKKPLVVLLVIALISSVIGVGLWIASAVLVYIHYQKDDDDERSRIQTDGNSSGQTLELHNSRVEKEKKSEKAAGPTVEETSKPSEQNKASPGLMYAEVGSHVRPAAVMPPASDENVRYTLIQSRTKDPAGTKVAILESSEPQQSERDAPPPRPPKTNQEDAAPPPRPPKTHQHTAESRKN